MSAIISADGRYRYVLHRDIAECEGAGEAVFVMLNPSTADSTQDDPTVRRCVRFARDWGYAGLTVVNLYALRSTDPKQLWETEDPVGPENDDWVLGAVVHASVTVCAWGANAQPHRVKRFWLAAGILGHPLYCLGTTKAGHPRHPLYVRADQPLEEYTPPLSWVAL